jgi:hypothetical protein
MTRRGNSLELISSKNNVRLLRVSSCNNTEPHIDY